MNMMWLWLAFAEIAMISIWLAKPTTAGLWLGGVIGALVLVASYQRTRLVRFIDTHSELQSYLWFLPLASLPVLLGLSLALAVASGSWVVWALAVSTYITLYWRQVHIPPFATAHVHRLAVLFAGALAALVFVRTVFDAQAFQLGALIFVVLLPILSISALLLRMFNQSRWRRQVRS